MSQSASKPAPEHESACTPVLPASSVPASPRAEYPRSGIDHPNVLESRPRYVFGKGATRALRRQGRLPAVVYGGKGENDSLSLDYRSVRKRYLTGTFLSTPLQILIEGEIRRVIPKQVQLHPVRDDLLHVDFLRLDADTIIAVEVPVTFLNDDASPGLKRGGVLNVVRHSVELNCPSDAIPEFIEVDLTGSEIGDSIHISAVRLPENVTPVITGRDFTIAGIVAPALMPDTEWTPEMEGVDSLKETVEPKSDKEESS